MTLKAIDILTKRSKDRDTGYMLMSEAAVSGVFVNKGTWRPMKLIYLPAYRQGDARAGCRPSAWRPARA